MVNEYEVLVSLKSLGKGKHKIAESLKKKRIKGRIRIPLSCPISKFLKKKFPEVVFKVGETGIFWNDTELGVEPPFAIKMFIKAFDKGKYPNLVQKLKK